MNTLDTLISEGLAFDPEWGSALSSHDSMTIVALVSLAPRAGWDMGRVADFAHTYRARLRPLEEYPSFVDFARLTTEDAFALAGDYALRGDYERWFAGRIEREGAEPVARDVLSHLGRGMPGAAGHGLLRIFYAFEMRKAVEEGTFRAELARALSYFAARHVVLARSRTPLRTLDEILVTVPPLNQVRQAAIKSIRLITPRQAVVARSTTYRPLFETIAAPADSAGMEAILARLAGTATVTPDFTLLHALTTGQAIVDLSDAIPDLDTYELRVGWAQFVLAALIVEQLSVGEGGPAGDPPRTDLIPLRTTNDDHAPKAAFSLIRLHARTSDARFLRASNRYVAAFAGPA